MPTTKIPRETYDEIAQMIRSGETTGSIGTRLGVTRERIRQIVAHHYPGALEEGRSVRRARAAEKTKCPDCGGTKSRTALRCISCVVHPTVWDRESIVNAIQNYNSKYGHPPSSIEWNPALARNRGQSDIAARFVSDGCWPGTSTVQYHFGSWSNAIAVAGFDPLPVGRPRKPASSSVGSYSTQRTPE